MLPKLYPILDVACFQSDDAIFSFARTLAAAGCTILQYRNKTGTAREMLAHARELRRLLPDLKLIMNDRADLALAANFNGVHVGQDDLSVEAVRKLVGPRMIVGYSTHNPEQVKTAHASQANYIAIGPVFGTVSKTNPDPVIGYDGVRLARSLTNKPLVAIGGITRDNCLRVIASGADSVAVISDLVSTPAKSAEQFMRVLV